MFYYFFNITLNLVKLNILFASLEFNIKIFQVIRKIIKNSSGNK